MGSKPYLIFSLHGLPYAIDASCVREIFFLPELIPVAEAPVDIIGLLDLRSEIIPIMHLDLRFGHHLKSCHLNDCAIVVETHRLQIGVVVHEVEEVSYIDSDLIKTDLSYGRDRNINTAFVAGVAEIGERVVFLLNVDNLVRYPNAVEALIEANGSEIQPKSVPKHAESFYELHFSEATAKEKAIMRQRAENLRIFEEQAENLELVTLAVVDINGEYFGIDLALVKEFTKIGKTTAIPRSPRHIIGNMNLRGEILTLIDLRRILNLPHDSPNNSTKAVAIDVDEIFAGIAVDRVLDVTSYHPKVINSLPLAIDANSSEYLKGTTSYLGKPMSIIDLSKMLSQELLTVNI